MFSIDCRCGSIDVKLQISLQDEVFKWFWSVDFLLPMFQSETIVSITLCINLHRTNILFTDFCHRTSPIKEWIVVILMIVFCVGEVTYSTSVATLIKVWKIDFFLINKTAYLILSKISTRLNYFTKNYCSCNPDSVFFFNNIYFHFRINFNTIR